MRDATRRKLIVAAYVLTFAGTFFLLFYNLENHLFWGDEAETATLAKNVLRFGLPKTFDGVNRITLYGPDIDARHTDIWTWSPWLQEYLTAGSFLIFGSTTWAGRAPFAFFSWLAVLLIGFAAFRFYRDHRISLAAIFLMGTSEVFLLHSRQCRYYGFSLFLEVLFIFGLHQLLSGRRAGIASLAAALVLLFYTNYILAIANLPILAPLAWTLYRRNRRSAWGVVLVAGLLVAAAVPWLFYAELGRQSSAVGQGGFLKKAMYYLIEFHFHFIPLIFLLLPAGAWLIARARRTLVGAALQSGANKAQVRSEGEARAISEFERHLLCLAGGYFCAILIPPGFYLRYLLPVLPVVCLLTAAWVFRHVKSTSAAAGLVGLQCFTNVLAIGSGFFLPGHHTLRWPVTEFVRGNQQRFRDRFSDVLEYLSREGHPGETVYAFDPEFPLIFYTGMKVTDGRLVGGAMTAPLPDWLLPESASGAANRPGMRLPDALWPYYEEIVLPVHQSLSFGVVPEPDHYQYQTGPIRPFVLYRKKQPEHFP
jgi:hypothetical protein